ncbi:MAG: VRR-NUC domain-containing protein, partial [Rubrobacteraceae bacterium]
PGYPDICAVKGERLLYIELKTEKGKLSEPQRQWLDALAVVPGAEVYVLRPSDFDKLLEIASF